MILQRIKSLLAGSDQNSGYQWNHDEEGINFILTKAQANSLKSGTGEPLLIHQHVALQMLVEQGLAEVLPNGVLVPSETVISIDDATKVLLELPGIWEGSLKADILGTTGSSAFHVDITASNEGSEYSHAYSVDGPLIIFSTKKKYLLPKYYYSIFKSLSEHEASDKSEYHDLKLIMALQDGQEAGAKIDLGHFDKLNIQAPDSITIEAELGEDGRLIITPNMGQQASYERIQRVLGQLRNENTSTLRVDDEIILFDEKRMDAVREILSSRIIPKEHVNEFLESPTAYIDASLVNLDVGFSIRVKGATKFKHAYFGQTDESGVDWFSKNFSLDDVLPSNKLRDAVKSAQDFTELKSIVSDAIAAGADELNYAGNAYDITDKSALNDILLDIERVLSEGGQRQETEHPVDDVDDDASEEQEDDSQYVVDIDLNDDELSKASSTLDKSLSETLCSESLLDWSNYKRKPYSHQEIGVRWILGLAISDGASGGGLLADDMGLGKSFMSLAAIEHLYKHYKNINKETKPCLIVAPLSLLENWKDEVGVTFKESPFKDVVILQSEGDLSRFRVGGVETRGQNLEGDEVHIKYSLKVGSSYAKDRLDMPARLVISTYQTLRDYQFSLCTIDWGIVVFDEAQNIKNPNALQSRAAKGLKADFRLLVTGTPVENTLAEFWCLMDTASPGVLGSYQQFRADYITPIIKAAGDEAEHVRAVIGRRLREKVGPLMLRRLKEDNLDGLPEKQIFAGVETESMRFLPSLRTVMDGIQLETYNTILSSVSESEENVVLSGLQKLRDVSLHPRLVFGGRLEVPEKQDAFLELLHESGKFDSLICILNEIQERNEKCIIFAINKKLQSFLSIALTRFYKLPLISIINGDAKAISKTGNTPTRKSMISAFENKPGFNIIIMSPVAAGVGLTVVGANNVVHFERHWNPAREAQATDRVYRIGQERDVRVYIPILHHPEYQSFDANLHQLLSKKSLLRDAVVTAEQVFPSPEGFDLKQWSPNAIITSVDLSKISWQQFEALCAELFAKEYNARSSWLTRQGYDYGADVAVISENDGLLIQCKHTLSKDYDGHAAILEVHAAKLKYQNDLGTPISKLIFATNAVRLSSRTRKISKQYSVDVLTFNELTVLLDKHNITYADVLRRLEMKRLKV